MATTPIIHVYQEINVGKYATVKHFKFLKAKGGAHQLSKRLNISKNREFAQSSPLFWVKESNGNNWEKKSLTGLFKTGLNGLLRGDVDNKKHLVVFKFNDEVNQLVVYYFKNEFSYDIDLFLLKIKQGYYEQKKTV